MTGSRTVRCEMFVVKGGINAAKHHEFNSFTNPLRDATKEQIFSYFLSV